MSILAGTSRRSIASSLPLLLHLLKLDSLLLKLLPLAVLRDLGEQLEQGEKQLSLLRPEIVAELLQLLHVLLDLLSLLVAGKLELVDALEHVGLPLLSRLELADEERAAAERPLRSLDSGPLSIFDTLVADEAEAKHAVSRFSGAAAGIDDALSRRLFRQHQLQVADFAKRGEEVDKLLLCALD